VDALERLAGGASRAVRKLALAAGVAAVVIVAFVLRDGMPSGGGDIARAVVAIGLAAAPPVILFVLAAALRALSELPSRVRALPADAHARLGDIGRLAGDARDARGARAPMLLWRVLRSARSSGELLTPHAGVLPLLSLPFLGASALAAAGAVIEIAIAVVLAIVMLA
jgi:hypothetical protein